MNCRHCNTSLKNVFVDLHSSPPSNSFLSFEDLNKPELFYPLKTYVCDNCFLVQIDEFKNAHDIFNDEYVYFSSYSKSWLEHSERYCEKMIKRFGYNSTSSIIEIASNDGYLLQFFLKKGIPVLGIEPTTNTAEVAIKKGIETITEYFSVDSASEIIKTRKKADLLLGNNVLAHVPNINDFVDGMKIILSENGVITMEFPHLYQLVKYNQFDTIYHEHFSYLSLFSVIKIFKNSGLEIFDVEELPTHGGSLRIYAKHIEDQTKSINSNVNKVLQQEIKAGINTLEYYKNFQSNCEIAKLDFLNFILSAKKSGKKIVGYGAAAKGNTLINYCGIKKDLINYVVDINPNKQNKFLPGSHIPVLNEDILKKERPHYVIIFPWNIKDEIIEQLNYIKDWGGKFITVIPEIKIIDPITKN